MINAGLIYINMEQLNETNGHYALASGVPTPHFNERFVNLNEVIEEIQKRCYAEANSLAEITLENKQNADGPLASEVSARYFALKELLDEIKPLAL